MTVTLTASDSGWGVNKTYYTTDGSAPTTSSPVYTGPFTVKQNTTVKFFSTDLAGNSEQPKTQVIAFAVVVSLTFDDGLQNQYQLGFLRALKPHHLNGTFYDISGLNNVDPDHMTWSEMTALNNGGNEIGGHTVHHVNLKTTTDFNTKVAEVCQDRQNLIDHGFYPVSFAYPEGAYDATAESIVHDCGYTSGRAAGVVDVAGDGAGPVYAETIPAKDLFALRTAYDPPAGSPPNVPPITLAHLKANVTAAAQQGGGWITEVLHQVCSQAFDPDSYSGCISDWGPIELDTLNAFLDWLQNAGQPGGAPAGTVVKTVSQVVNGPDTQAPITALQCDGSPCQAGRLPRIDHGRAGREGPRRVRREDDLLHHRRFHADHLEPGLRPAVHHQAADDAEVLLGGQRRQHRVRADAVGAGPGQCRSDRRRGRRHRLRPGLARVQQRRGHRHRLQGRGHRQPADRTWTRCCPSVTTSTTAAAWVRSSSPTARPGA